MPSTHGTWLTWFISQHKNFPALNLFNRCTKGIVTDYAISSCQWWHGYNPDPQALAGKIAFKKQTWDEFVETQHNRTGASDKLAFKVCPFHGMEHEEEYLPNVIADSKAHVIVPYVDTIMANEFNSRKEIIRPDWGHKPLNIQSTKHDLQYIENVTTVHWIDIGKILSADESEYIKLLNAIDEEPLDNWQELCHNVLREIYNKDL